MPLSPTLPRSRAWPWFFSKNNLCGFPLRQGASLKSRASALSTRLQMAPAWSPCLGREWPATSWAQAKVSVHEEPGYRPQRGG